jgi:DNA-binding NarL/FixJ family response regulator
VASEDFRADAVVAPPVKVFVICEMRFYRDAVTALLDGESDLEVVGSSSSFADARDRIEQSAPSVVLLDMSRNLPELPDELSNGARQVAEFRLVVLVDAETEDAIIMCAEAGALACLSADCGADSVISTLRQAANGEARYSPRMTAAVLKRLRTLSLRTPPVHRVANLTGREREVVDLVVEGLSNKEIAQRLTIEVATVKNHVHSIYRKLNIRRRSQLSAWLLDGRHRASAPWAA